MIDLTSHDSVEKCLIKDPIVLPPNTNLMEAANIMAQVKNCCQVDDKVGAEISSSKASCILVMEDDRLRGIVTDRDFLQLVIAKEEWHQMTLGEVMTSPAIAIKRDEFLNSLDISQLLQKYRIRHLPVLDHNGKLFGLITHQLLRSVIEPLHLLRLRFVKEVMVDQVVHGTESHSIWELAELMLEHKIGSIVITHPHPDIEGAVIPLGLVTEQDVLHMRALDLDLKIIQAGQAMTSPAIPISAYDSLIEAKQIMEDHKTHRLVVVGKHNELVGLVTQSNLLEAMNQNDMYNLVHFLEKQIQERTQELDQVNQKLYLEIQERKKAEQRIRQLSLTDELTGLYNRRGFFVLVEQELKIIEHRVLPFSFFFFDVDNLKQINDQLGHEMGDQVIVDAAEHLTACFRKSDVLARLGGDEFICFALANQPEAELLSVRLQTAIATFNQRQHRPYELSISIGYVSYEELPSEHSIIHLIREADEQMYINKKSKKGQQLNMPLQ